MSDSGRNTLVVNPSPDAICRASCACSKAGNKAIGSENLANDTNAMKAGTTSSPTTTSRDFILGSLRDVPTFNIASPGFYIVVISFKITTIADSNNK